MLITLIKLIKIKSCLNNFVKKYLKIIKDYIIKILIILF